MTDDDKARLVDELAEAIHEVFKKWPSAPPEWEDMATACLPIIDRLLAAHDLDALLDSVGKPTDIDDLRTLFSEVRATLRVYDPDDGYYLRHGTGPTRLAAIRNAVAQAKAASE